MKKLHLVCNAHLDPIWQWEWEEGAAAALSTFQSAANLLKEYNYTFTHNEVTLYRYTEKYAPALFREMQDLVKEGKWCISGGWFLQPDCLMPSGEGIIRQIQTGKEYFTEKFNSYPKTAINYDPFGHSRGLVQIIKKCGQENYVFMRPYSNWGNNMQLELPSDLFIWEGYDGSQINAYRVSAYNSVLGQARGKIEGDIKFHADEEISMSPWGVGNHGGGPSRIDLENIDKLMKEKHDIEIIHSTPDAFFNEAKATKKYDKSLISCMVGCYSSMIELKQKYRELERQLFFTEKIASIASLKGVMTYPGKTLQEVTEDMLNCEFHDILPGSSIKAGENNGFTYINHGLHLLNQVRADAYFGLVKGQPVAEPDTYPVMVFNPKTYDVEQYVEGELSIIPPYDLPHDEMVQLEVFDENGNKVPSQNIKEGSNIAFEWRKRLIFKAKLKPLEITRFTVKTKTIKKPIYDLNKDVCFKNDVKSVVISAKTGLIESYKVNGKEMVKTPLFAPYLYDDCGDPWGMERKIVGWDPKPFVKMENPHGPFAGLQSFEVIEDGDIYLACEAFFECEETKLRIGYKIYKEGDLVDVDINVFPCEANRSIKVHIPLVGEEFIGEQIFGCEPLFKDGRECVAHDYLALKQEDGNYIEIITPSTFASSYKNGELISTLMRTPTYCAHPIPGYPLVRENIFIQKIDQGQRDFSFRLTMAKENELKRNASLFIEKPYALNIFPTIDNKEDNGSKISTDNPNINVVTIKKGIQKDGYILRLENNSSLSQSCTINVNNKVIALDFAKFEVKTVLFDGDLKELDQMYI